MIQKGLSPGSTAIVKNVISGVMERAIDLELIVSNPANGTLRKLPPSKKYSKKDIEIFTTEQIEHLLTTCKKYIPHYHPLILCAFRTGMRLGEILGLNWSDINWNENYIRVQRSYKNQVISETKNKRNRNIDLSPQLKEELQTLHLIEKKSALKQRRDTRDSVFKTARVKGFHKTLYVEAGNDFWHWQNMTIGNSISQGTHLRVY